MRVFARPLAWATTLIRIKYPLVKNHMLFWSDINEAGGFGQQIQEVQK